MSALKHLFEQNKAWSDKMIKEDPAFFSKLSTQQNPDYLWIGCADSRVPANEIIGLPPGEVFVHRNVANVVVHSDLNCLSVIQYAVEVLQVEHIIVCGHYGCGGVQAAMQRQENGLIDNWLRHIKDVYSKNREQLEAIDNEEDRFKRFCELNVIQQVYNVCETTIVQRAWKKGQKLSVQGWVYGLHDGLIQDLGVQINSAETLEPIYNMLIKG
ncbi:MAG: carbonate dehydratase [Phototrophicaceae bacterium]